MDSERRRRAESFVELHRSGCFLLPNAWDAGSARILEAAGFPAIATTSAGVAFSLGLPDHDYFSEYPAGAGRPSLPDMIRRVSEIAGAVGIPVSADLEEGYGRDPEEVAATITQALGAGAAGGNIEDFTGDRAEPLFAPELAVDRIRAARAAVDASGEPFVLVGRTDALLVGGSIDECVRRANAYLAAGADCAFVPGASDADSIGRLAREIDGPLNVVMGLTGNALTLDDLRELGVRRVTVGGSIARSMYHHLRQAATELAEKGTFGYAGQQMSQNELNNLFRR